MATTSSPPLMCIKSPNQTTLLINTTRWSSCLSLSTEGFSVFCQTIDQMRQSHFSQGGKKDRHSLETTKPAFHSCCSSTVFQGHPHVTLHDVLCPSSWDCESMWLKQCCPSHLSNCRSHVLSHSHNLEWESLPHGQEEKMIETLLNKTNPIEEIQKKVWLYFKNIWKFVWLFFFFFNQKTRRTCFAIYF